MNEQDKLVESLAEKLQESDGTFDVEYNEDFQFDSDNGVIVIDGVGVTNELGLGKNLLKSIEAFEKTENIEVLDANGKEFLNNNADNIFVATYYESGSQGIKVNIYEMANGRNLKLNELQ